MPGYERAGPWRAPHILPFAARLAMIEAANVSTPLSLAIVASISVAAMVTMAAGAVAVGIYHPDVRFNPTRRLTATGLAAIVALAIPLVLAGGTDDGFTGATALTMAKLLAAWIAGLAVIRLAYGFAMRHRRGFVGRRIVFLGDPGQSDAFHARLRSRQGRGFDPVALHGQDVGWQSLRQHRVWGVVLGARPDDSAVEPLLDCKLRGMPIFSSSAFHERYLGRIDLDTLTAGGLLTSPGFAAGQATAAAKRVCDIVIGIGMLLATLPLMAVTALAIKLDSPGAVFYRQRRVGQFGKTFTLLKFRSMTEDAEAGGTPRWAQQHDPRITRIGRFIRATRIDELPQLVNIIGGAMSLVGPRPERPHFVQQLDRAVPFYQQRSYAKPGLTGWAQVNYPYGASVEDSREKLSYDLYYVKNHTILLDAIILFSTLRVVLLREGAR